MKSIYHFLIFGSFACCLWACETDCCEFCEDTCPNLNVSQTALLITDFEIGYDPTEHCGYVGTWKDDSSYTQVVVIYDSVGGGSGGSSNYVKVILAGNDGDTPYGWSGGGLSLTFHDDTLGLDLSGFQYLAFEAKMLPGSHLGQSLIKLEDTRGTDSLRLPERQIQLPSLSFDWQTITIPITMFDTTHVNGVPGWDPLDVRDVIRIVTISRHQGIQSQNVDGALCIDNVRFLR